MGEPLKLFWMDYATGEGREASEAEIASEEETLDKMTELSSIDSFQGIIPESGASAQFIYDGEGKLKLDIPDIENDGSYIKNIDLKEALQIIRDVFNGKDPMTIEGIKFDSWY